MGEKVAVVVAVMMVAGEIVGDFRVRAYQSFSALILLYNIHPTPFLHPFKFHQASQSLFLLRPWLSYRSQSASLEHTILLKDGLWRTYQ